MLPRLYIILSFLFVNRFDFQVFDRTRVNLFFCLQVQESTIHVDKVVTEIEAVPVKVSVELLVDRITIVDKLIDKVVNVEVDQVKEEKELVPFVEQYLVAQPEEQQLPSRENKVQLRRDVPKRLNRPVDVITTTEKLHPVTTVESKEKDKPVEVRVWQDRLTVREVPREVEVPRMVEVPRVVEVETAESKAAADQLAALEKRLDDAVLENRRRELEHVRARKRLEAEIEEEQQFGLQLSKALKEQTAPVEVVRQVVREREVVVKKQVSLPAARPATTSVVGGALGDTLEDEVRKHQALVKAEQEYQKALERERQEAEAERLRLQRSLENAQRRVEQLEREARARRDALAASKRGVESREVVKTITVGSVIRVPQQ